MLEEKNDNLHNADGENFKKLAEAVTNLNVPEDGDIAGNDDLEIITSVRETEGQLPFMPLVEETTTEAAVAETDAIGDALIEESKADAGHTETQSAMEAIESSNAEESEDE